MSILRSLRVDDNLTSNGTALLHLLTVSDATILQSTLDVTGNTTLNSDLHTVGDVVFDNTLTVSQLAAFNACVAISEELIVGGATDLQNTLDVQGKAHFMSDVSVDGDLHVNGSIITRHQEEVFIGDSHLVLNSGGTTVGSSASGTCSIYAIDRVLASDYAVEFVGDENGVPATGSGFIRIVQKTGRPIDPLLIAAWDKCIVSVTGQSPYDGLYIFDGSDVTKQRLCSHRPDANGVDVDWALRMPFLKSPQWGPGTLTNIALHMTLSLVRISHIMTNNQGLLSWCRGATSDDFWDPTAGISLYVPLSMQGGLSEYQTMSASGTVHATVVALLVPGITATLDSADALGITHKIFNKSTGVCTIAAPAGQTIDGVNSYLMDDRSHIVVTKVASGEYAIM